MPEASVSSASWGISPASATRRARPTRRASTHLGLLPLGYADGLPRSASGRAEVWVRGRRCPIAGVVCMDQAVVDLGDRPVPPGEPTAAEWAAWAGMLEHEIVTGLGPRVRRIWLPAVPSTSAGSTPVPPDLRRP